MWMLEAAGYKDLSALLESFQMVHKDLLWLYLSLWFQIKQWFLLSFTKTELFLQSFAPREPFSQSVSIVFYCLLPNSECSLLHGAWIHCAAPSVGFLLCHCADEQLTASLSSLLSGWFCGNTLSATTTSFVVLKTAVHVHINRTI